MNSPHKPVLLGALSCLLLVGGNLTLRAASRPQAPSSTQPSATNAKPAAPTPQTPAPNSTVVWVNTASHRYHLPGSRYYGKTKQGKYMTEADAIKAGYRPAEKK